MITTGAVQEPHPAAGIKQEGDVYIHDRPRYADLIQIPDYHTHHHAVGSGWTCLQFRVHADQAHATLIERVLELSTL